MERVNKVILSMLVTKDPDNRVFDHIDLLDENLAYIAWEIRASYHRTIMATSGQAIFGRDMIFNLSLFVDWKVLTAAKQRQADIANVRKKKRQVTHEYAIDYQVYVERLESTANKIIRKRDRIESQKYLQAAQSESNRDK